MPNLVRMELQAPPGEEALIADAQRNPERFAPLYEKYYHQIYIFICKRVANRDTVADITSQVFVQAISHISSYRNQGFPFSSWLYRIANNEVAMFYRKTGNKVFVDVNEEGIAKIETDSGLQLLNKENSQYLFYLLNCLNKQEMEIIQLRYFEDKSYTEISEILNISENSARIKVFRAIKKLQEKKNGKQ